VATERVQAYAEAVLAIVEAEGHSAEASDELFRFARVFEGNDALRDALVDQSLPLERRLAVVEELLGPTALRVTTAVVTFIVAAGRASELPAIIDRFTELAAAARERAVAEVRTAVPLDDATVAELARALSRATGKQVEVKVVVDERVLGGIVARIGDTVIDGTVRHKLETLRETVGR
jgi:F-type H+-transporting ATPase subunit delta